MDEVVVTQVDPNMGYTTAVDAEKHQITGLQMAPCNRATVFILCKSGTWQRDASVLMRVKYQSAAIEPGFRRAATVLVWHPKLATGALDNLRGKV